MCRSAAQGGRRCPGSSRSTTSAPSPATTAETGSVSASTPAPQPAASYAAAEAELDAARTAIDGRSWGSSATGLLASALAEQARARRDGGDPGIWDENADLGRQILRNTLTGRGDSAEAAAAKVARFEAAYATWDATPEDSATTRATTRAAARARPVDEQATSAHADSQSGGQGGGQGGGSRWSLNGANVTFVGGNDVVGQVIGHRTQTTYTAADGSTAAGAGGAGDSGRARSRWEGTREAGGAAYGPGDGGGDVLNVRFGDAYVGSRTGGTSIDIPEES